MARTSFNAGWTVKPKVSSFSDLVGGAGEDVSVTLPHDAMISLRRSETESEGPSTGYFPGGVVELLEDAARSGGLGRPARLYRVPGCLPGPDGVRQPRVRRSAPQWVRSVPRIPRRVLQAQGSAGPATEERFDSHQVTTFDGRALAGVRPTGPGAIAVAVRSDGLPPATLELQVLPYRGGYADSCLHHRPVN